MKLNILLMRGKRSLKADFFKIVISVMKMSSKNYNFYCIYFSTIFAEVK